MESEGRGNLLEIKEKGGNDLEDVLFAHRIVRVKHYTDFKHEYFLLHLATRPRTQTRIIFILSATVARTKAREDIPLGSPPNSYLLIYMYILF